MHTRISENTLIIRMTSGKLPSLPFVRIKDHILGKNYELSLVFPTLQKSIELHKQFKKKNTPVNILSFPLAKNEGEIYITLSAARSECKNFFLTYHEYLQYLFIHGCVHLLGNDHGDVMDALEKKFCKKFTIPYPYKKHE